MVSRIVENPGSWCAATATTIPISALFILSTRAGCNPKDDRFQTRWTENWMSLGHVAWLGIIQEAAGYCELFPVYFLIPNNIRHARREYIVAIPSNRNIKRKKKNTNP